MTDRPNTDYAPVTLPRREDVQMAVEAICYWLDNNTWIDLHDDEAYVVEAIEQAALLLKWAPTTVKAKLIESWGYDLDRPLRAQIDGSDGDA